MSWMLEKPVADHIGSRYTTEMLQKSFSGHLVRFYQSFNKTRRVNVIIECETLHFVRFFQNIEGSLSLIGAS